MRSPSTTLVVLFACAALLVRPAAAQRAPSTPATFGAGRTTDPRYISKRGTFPFPVELVWETTLDAPPSAPPAYDEHQMYVPLRMDAGQLVAVGLSSGDRQWTVDVATSLAPAVCGGSVLVATDAALESREASSGEVRWRFAVPDKIVAPAVCAANIAVIGTTAGDLIGVHATDSVELWRQPMGSPLRSAPVIEGERLYLALDDHRIASFDVRTGAKAWERRLVGAPTGILAASGRLYIGSLDNHLYCFDSNSGEFDWQVRTGGDIVGAPIGDDDAVYFVSLDNVLRAVGRKSGTLRWKAPLSTRAANGPVHLGDAILVVGVSSELMAFKTIDGSRAGEFSAPSRPIGLPHRVVGLSPLSRLIVLTGDGIIQTVVSMIDPAFAALDNLPGTTIPAEQFATEPDWQPLDYLPGLELPREKNGMIE